MAEHSPQKLTPKPGKGAVVFDAVKGGATPKSPASVGSYVAKKGKEADPRLLDTVRKWQEGAERTRAKASATKTSAGGVPELAETLTEVRSSAYRPDARARAVLRGVKMTEDMLVAAGGAFDLAEVQALFRGVSRQAIDKRVQDGSLLAVPGPGGSRVYPTFQFQTDGSLMPGLKQVQAALPSRSPWAVLAFLMTPHADLGPRETPRRPVDLLREGDLALVLLAAQGIGVQGS